MTNKQVWAVMLFTQLFSWATILVFQAAFTNTGGGGCATPSIPMEYGVPDQWRDLKTLAEPVRDALNDAHPSTRKLVGEFYTDFADVIERDRFQVTTVRVFNTALGRAETIMFQRTGHEAPGFSAAARGFMASAVGLEDVPIDDAKRAEIVNALETIAWSALHDSTAI